MMEYKGYKAAVEYDPDDEAFHGVVVNIEDTVHFQATTVRGLKKAFRDSLEDYLEWCQKQGKTPDRPCSGKFMVRMRPELHRQALLAAKMTGRSLNVFVAEAVESAAKQAGV